MNIQFSSFQYSIHVTTSGHSCCLYARDPSAALQRQANSVRSDEIVTVHIGNGKPSHPFSPDMRRFVCTDIEEEVKQSMDADTVWYFSDFARKTFAAGSIQLHSNKSQISLAAGS